MFCCGSAPSEMHRLVVEAYQGDGNVGRIGEHEGNLLELGPSTEVFGEEEPARGEHAHGLRPASQFAYQPAPLSPRPWATMMVAVCRLSAGTTMGALPAICACLGGWGSFEGALVLVLMSPSRCQLMRAGVEGRHFRPVQCPCPASV